MAIQHNVGSEARGQASPTKARSLRVKVVDKRDGRAVSNVTVPIGMVKWGIRMAARFAPEMQDADLDWDAIGQMIEDGARGELVHVEDEEKHQTVSVSVE